MLYQQIERNKRKTIFLVFLFCLIVLGIGSSISYLSTGEVISGVILAAILLIIYVPATYMSATSQVLRMSGASEIRQEDHPQLYSIVEELTIAARLPMPKIYIVNDSAPNAFATGIKPEKGAVVFTTGLLERLNREELTGVVAHELAHIRNYDIRLMTICIALVGIIVFIGQIGSRLLFFGRGRRGSQKKMHPILALLAVLFVIFAPLAAQFVRLAVSRNREYLADATAVDFTRNPTGLIRALQKISTDNREVKHATAATASMYINQPFRRKRKKRNLFATHPPIESRIERLRNM